MPYALAMRMRNWCYDSGRAAVHRVGVPVVSVGNLTLGGTGKTPMVEWIARWARARQIRVAIVSRGYGAGRGVRNDEALELEQKLPDVPHVQNADRVSAARMAIEEFETQWLVLDDAFQHRRIARDLDIVLLDATEPFGYGHVFPRGLLREPASGLGRADVVALSRADLVDADTRRQIRETAGRYAPRALWLEVSHAPQALLSADGERAGPERLRGKVVAAFAGIGNPAGFRRTLARLGTTLGGWREFADHHAYDRQDVEWLKRWAAGLDVDAVVCTHKDLVKVGLAQLAGKPLWALAIGLEFLAGQAEFESRLEALAQRCRQPAD